MLAIAQPHQAVGFRERVELGQVEPAVGDREHRMISAQALLGACVGRVHLAGELANEVIGVLGQAKRPAALGL